MQKKWSGIVFAIGSFLLGSIIGALTENQLNSGVNPAYLAILVLSIALFTIIVIVKTSISEQMEREQNTITAIQNIEKRFGLKVTYQELKKVGQGAGDEDDKLATLMRNANFEILEIGLSDVHDHKDNPDLAVSEIRQRYYDSIIERVETQISKGAKFTYKRICQFPRSGRTLRTLKDTIFVEHCKKMVSLNHNKGIQSYVKRSRVSLPIAFIIIDRQHLVVSIDTFRYKGGNNERFMKGELIISDPQQELISVFMNEFDTVENSPNTHTVSLDEFE